MIYNVNELRKDTVAMIRDIDSQIAAVEKRAEEMGIHPHLMQDSQGYWPMIPLMAAKATAYNTLVLLQSSGTSSAGPGARPASRQH